MLIDPEDANTAVWLLLLLSPATLAGIYGITAALRRKRAAAIRAGLCAAVPGTGYYLFLGIDLFTGFRVESLSHFLALFGCGGIPFFVGFWALLLAYLIPESPPDT